MNSIIIGEQDGI